MRFAVPANDFRLQELVVALDRDDVSVATTWRAVGDAAERLGLRRPSYSSVRRLVVVERLRRHRSAAVKQAALEAAAAVASPYLVDFRVALGRLRDAQRDERLVLQRHKVAQERSD